MSLCSLAWTGFNEGARYGFENKFKIYMFNIFRSKGKKVGEPLRLFDHD